jgi:hypothetical protein
MNIIALDIIRCDAAVNAARLKAAREHLDALTPIVEELHGNIRIYEREEVELNALAEQILNGDKP